MLRICAVLACFVVAVAPKVQAGSSTGLYRATPDFGGVVTRHVEAEGVGVTMEDATLRALDAAISQVNGRRVRSMQGSAQAAISIDLNGMRRVSASSEGFAEFIVSSSNGAIRSFTLVSSEEVTRTEAEQSLDFSAEGGTSWVKDLDASLSAESKVYSHYWRVRISADVAKYEAPRDEGKPRLAIAKTQLAADHYLVGEKRLPAGSLGKRLRRNLNDAVSQTERFLLLDRELAPALQEEIAFINGGEARVEDVARLGQQLAADLILISTIERFEYRRHTRQLRLSDRELVSYAGGGTVSVKVINATTGEIVISRTFTDELPPLNDSTQHREVNADALATQLTDKLTRKILQALIEEVFPVSVIAMTGDQLILSQGGIAVRTGNLYQVVHLGELLVDPQTGRSLGRSEFLAGVARVDRVADQTAYATLIESRLPEQVEFHPGMLELRGVVSEGLAESETPTSDDVKTKKMLPETHFRGRIKSKDDKDW